jgi:WhiB family redox-sensing transcriptional regulator
MDFSDQDTPASLLTLAMPDGASEAMGDWVLAAACATADPEIFFPTPGKPGLKAKKVCARCLVRPDCLQYALASGQDWGVWGGLDEAERQRLARRRKRLRARTQKGATAGGVA